MTRESDLKDLIAAIIQHELATNTKERRAHAGFDSLQHTEVVGNMEKYKAVLHSLTAQLHLRMSMQRVFP